MATGQKWSALFPRLHLDQEAVWQAFAWMEAAGVSLAFHGHTHVQMVWQWGLRLDAQDFTGALLTLAPLKTPVDAFFDGVMVMADDAKLRENRLALLSDLQWLMNRVADISRLAT